MSLMFRLSLPALLVGSLWGAESPPSSDVPEMAQHDIIRRGNMAQDVGTIQADVVDVIAATLAPPEDDSGKWFLTVVTSDDPKYRGTCDKLLHDINTALPLQAWIQADDPKNSWSHYQVRRVEDATQQDWLKGIRSKVDEGGYPALILQPPRDGSLGPNKTVVSIVYGYDGNPDTLSKRIQGIVAAYANTIATKRQAAQAMQPAAPQGHAQPIAAPPPFPIEGRKVDPFQPSGPVSVYPALKPPALTYSQIRVEFPEFPPSEARKLAKEGLTHEQLASELAAYLDAQEELAEGKEGVEQTPVNPTPEPTRPADNLLWIVAGALGLLMFGGPLKNALSRLQRSESSGTGKNSS